jgi:hypothetical protein
MHILRNIHAGIVWGLECILGGVAPKPLYSSFQNIFKEKKRAKVNKIQKEENGVWGRNPQNVSQRRFLGAKPL